MDALRKVGDVAGTGLGVALTPLAMAQAARSGRNPLELLAQIQQGDTLARQKALLTQATALQNPGVRALLVQQPELAGTFGAETVPGGIASPDVLARAGLQGAAPGGQVPVLPERYVSPTESAATSRQNYFNQLLNMAKGASGSGERVSYGPSGPSVAPPSYVDVETGEMNPATGKPYQVGEPIAGGGGQVRRIKPSKAGQKAAQEISGQRVRSTGAFGMLDSLEASVNKLYTADKISGIPGQTASLYKKAIEGDEDAVNIQTAQGRLPVIVEALQKDGRISNQDASFLMGNLPAFYDSKPRALAKLKAIRDTLTRKNINLDAEMQALSGEGAAPAETGAPAAPGTETEVPDDVKSARDRIRALGAPLARAGGGDIPLGRDAIVGEVAPEMVRNTPAGVQVVPLQPQEPRRIGLGPGVSAPDYEMSGQAAPRQLQPRGGLGRGEGLSVEDAAAARGGAKGTITLGPDGLPVFVRQ